ncbi:TrpB-like pyridoxal phosphate-dependent enzyme [Dehalogenimonas alkenigignens]|uniref:Tryptophan synthase beta chain n=1 Tax=Dehalogenimonas alkenigignens TaxID=1217799 RepID=A0A0W0GIQ6_9CHLR|nr:TrpB-like pyridoxal phosphate-dependent enzyme [Dehalogenimonas alkenigignens]KTB48441.1 pyridoxal-phosphate dependent TrpB-like enzyme [Dehalogenimonas alkenigignens]PVV85105.1 TrpB-like pyridoxal phosphate-dependent enzyme [Dehalogenimonas alkenigignens]
MDRVKYLLAEKEMPTAWYNIQADLPVPLPPVLHPGTKQPLTPPDLAPLFPMELIMQEVSRERYIDVPGEVIDIYRSWRPTTLFRARRLEKALQTPAKIFYKYEGSSPAGSHKPNTAVPQAFYNKKEGIKRLTTETGAGQWGSSLAFACSQFGLDLKVYMVKVSYQQKPYRRMMMETWGAKCVPSPSMDTNSGRAALEADPNNPGSLGLAISEAVEDAAPKPDTHYSLGSVLNHVLMHQTVIGLEAIKQMEHAGEYPDVVIGCVGGGSNFGGMALPFVHQNLTAGKKTRIVAVEPSSCPSLTKGLYEFDYGDVAGIAPIAKMYTLGHKFMPPPVHAGGLRYHGMAPIVSHLYKLGLIEAKAVNQLPTFEAGLQFARTEGFISAPETNHAIRAAIDEALKCRETGEKKVILFNHSGHGHFDMAAYDAYLSGKLTDYEYPESLVREALKDLPRCIVG